MLRINLRRSAIDVPAGTLRNATREWARRESALLELTRNGEVLGRGEVTPLPGYGPDTLEQAIAGLRNLDARRLESTLAQASIDLDEFSPLLDELSSSATFALECAVLDAVGKRRGIPVWQLLADDASNAAPPPDPCQLRTLSEVAARETALRGCAKFKIGRDVPREVEVLRQIAARSPELSIRLDANRSLPPTSIDVVLAELAALQPEFVEEPCPLRQLGTPRRLPIPLALDESLQSEQDLDLVRCWLNAGQVTALVLKPMAIGGIAKALRWSRVAAAAGAKVVVSHCFDGAISMAAYRHLARALSANALAPGLAAHAGALLWNEFVDVPDDLSKPGLGLRQDPNPMMGGRSEPLAEESGNGLE